MHKIYKAGEVSFVLFVPFVDKQFFVLFVASIAAGGSQSFMYHQIDVSILLH